MLKFAANLSFMYQEYPLIERFAAAKTDGFNGVEFFFPYDEDVPAIAAELKRLDLQLVLFNSYPGDFSKGERGIGALPGREDEFQMRMQEAYRIAGQLNCPRIHVMGGLIPAHANKADYFAVFEKNLRATLRTIPKGITLLIEPINTRDIPGYLTNTQAEAHALIDAINHPQLKVQMDLYHCAIVEGDVAMKIRQYLPTGNVAHIQVAGVPERHEPQTGELHYPYLFSVLEELGYDAWISGEYRPKNGTSSGLAWMKQA